MNPDEARAVPTDPDHVLALYDQDEDDRVRDQLASLASEYRVGKPDLYGLMSIRRRTMPERAWISLTRALRGLSRHVWNYSWLYILILIAVFGSFVAGGWWADRGANCHSVTEDTTPYDCNYEGDTGRVGYVVTDESPEWGMSTGDMRRALEAEKPAAGGDTDQPTVEQLLAQAESWRRTGDPNDLITVVIVGLADAVRDHAAVTHELAEWKQRMWATVHERAAWQHDRGEHAGDLPYAHCAACEMEHPKGRLAAYREFVRAYDARDVVHNLAAEDRLPALLVLR